MTRTVVARGYKWSEVAIRDGWGSDTSDEEAAELADSVVAQFHADCDELGCSFHWTPGTSEVTAEVYGQTTDEHSMWDYVNEADRDADLDELLDCALQVVSERLYGGEI